MSTHIYFLCMHTNMHTPHSLRPYYYFSNAEAIYDKSLKWRGVTNLSHLYILATESRWWGRAIWQTCLCFSNHEILYSMPLNHFITTPSLFSSVCVSPSLSVSLSFPSLSCLAYYRLSMCQTLSNPHASLPSPCFSPQWAVLLSQDTSNKETENLVSYAIIDYISPRTAHNVDDMVSRLNSSVGA